ncbi:MULTISPECIES: carboxymuconolactone decarboxylase family protein [Acinetobacter]|jgi:AhpD family alkylhydroperoxidase|uniref:Carboxymuconolactone decarboxylase family protein n=2 Tax=Acinetobacter TaxID=469 RepID=A0A4Q7B4Y8_9GAMM|nr:MULTISPECIES: carboxymuconolactone decarboxylase family protein [Acinetobacter]MCW8038624.1 carboxymuconolactone decarboxylase family protein [Acinetobacter entericus]RZG69853.1 carboxymuconolactone decarboxylase family protein [Acinetobacter bouvetii]TCB74896.1 carboxymuconolactone decarboxylase family protein [Acinetobacter sp. ANC 4177]
MSRINLGQSAPDLYKKVAELDDLAMQKIQEAQLSEGFAHLLKLRASQINQCAFCIRLHTQDALKTGETAERIALLSAWRETEYYDQAEGAALSLMEAITLVAEGQVPDEVYEDALPFLTDAQISAVEWLAVVINAWNRIAVSSRYSVKP